jgi:hypothetical protein
MPRQKGLTVRYPWPYTAPYIGYFTVTVCIPNIAGDNGGNLENHVGEKTVALAL